MLTEVGLFKNGNIDYESAGKNLTQHVPDTSWA